VVIEGARGVAEWAVDVNRQWTVSLQAGQAEWWKNLAEKE
jgi:hypothetical protein